MARNPTQKCGFRGCNVKTPTKASRYCREHMLDIVLKTNAQMRTGKGKYGRKWKANLLAGLK